MKKKVSIVTLIIAGVGVAAGAYLASDTESKQGRAVAQERAERSSGAEDTPGDVKVEVVKPRQGGIERTTTQPITIESFESARLFSKVSGYLKEQRVDIGDRVKCGDVLAVIDMPEMEKQVQRDEAAVEAAEAFIVQTQARVETVKADYEAAKALIGEREADVELAESTLSYKAKVFHRIERLVAEKAVDQQLADEKEEDYHAARAGRLSAKAALVSAKAMATAAKARIDQALADLVDAKAKLSVAQEELAKDKVFVDYTIIHSPYDGVVTFRGYHRGDFINARDQGATIPLLTVDRTDKMRCVVQIPDLDVPFVNKGDEAEVQIDALPGRKFSGTVARVAHSEDQTTRTMRSEIDLMNDKNLLRDGMYGKVTVNLDKAPDGLTVPSSALVGESRGGKGTLYVIRGGKAHKLEVSLGADNGVEAEITSGLKADDEVVVHTFKGSISNGVTVAVVNGR